MVKAFTTAEVEAMCRRCGVGRDQLHDALRRLGPGILPQGQRARWTPDNPTAECCYRVTEAVYRSGRMPSGFRVMRKPGPDISHYFFQHPATGEIVDPTADQFLLPDGLGTPAPVGFDYDGARPGSFMPQLSRGAKAIMAALGWAAKSRQPE